MTARRIILFSALCLILMTGCQRDRVPGTGVIPKRSGKVVLRYGLELPPGIAADLIAPLTGEGLSKAVLTTDEVLAGLTRPAFLDTPVEVDPSNEADQVEPPLAAQKAYAAGRNAWRLGDVATAKKQLESALRLAPNEPRLLRLLGEIYTRSGNRIKGAQYFRRAVDLAPDDSRSLFILGRFAIEKGEHGEAAVLFDEVLIREHTDPALTELSYHFLGNTLRSMGHAAAAIEQFDQYVVLTASPVKRSIFSRDQVLLRRQIGVTRQLLGDLYMQLDQPAEALRTYGLALEAGVPDAIKLDKRRVYAALRLSDHETAEKLVIDQVQRHQGDAQSLAMVRYIVAQGVPAARVAEALRAIYESQGRPASMAIATADVLPGEQAQELLTEHLAQSPGDRRAFHTLLSNYLIPADQAPHDQTALRRAVDLTAELMSKQPELADEYGSALVTQTHETQALLAVIGDDEIDGQAGTMRVVLRGLCLAMLEQYPEAQAQFQAAVTRAPDLAVARVELAKALIVQDDFDAAAEALEPLSDSNQTGVILLRANVLAETGKTEEAVGLINRVIQETGGDARLVINKANLELALGRAEDAERTLLDALNAKPKSEVLYAALLDLYDPAPGRKSLIEDQTSKWRVLVKRLLGTIPNSRTGRLVQAQLHEASRNYDRAAAILEGLLSENANDGKALNQLLDTYHAAGRTGEAIALLEARLEATPDDVRLLRMAQRFYSDAKDQQRLFEVQERMLLLEPPGPNRASALGFLYRRWGKYEQSVEVLEEALKEPKVENPVVLINLLAATLVDQGKPELAEKRIKAAVARFPDHEAELTYLLAMTVNGQGDHERGERVMRDLLKKFPDHGPTNNGLGYAMLMRNENIEQALGMIRRAVDGDPENEAYMDSLGWAHYKLGQFEDAEVWLRKARGVALNRARAAGPGGSDLSTLAIISDHLGDTLYRLGREPESLRTWSGAASHLRRVKPESLKQDPELESLAGRLRDKITAVRTKVPVPVSDVPQEAAAKEAGGDASEPVIKEPAPEAPQPVEPSADAPDEGGADAKPKAPQPAEPKVVTPPEPVVVPDAQEPGADVPEKP